MPIPIARSANSAWHVGWVMVGIGRALGKGSGVGLSGRLLVLNHGILGSWRRVLRCNHSVIRSFTFLAAGLVLWFGMGRFGVRYGGWFGSGLEGFDGGLGFKISISHMVVIEPGCETVGLFEVFGLGGTHDIADGWRESTGVFLDCLGNGGTW